MPAHSTAFEGIRFLPRLLILIFTLHHSALILSATPLTSLDDQATTLAAHLQSPATLVLIVSDPVDLPEAQRLLTLAYSEDLPALILIQQPNSSAESTALRHAARTYFKSDYSRAHLYYVQSADNPYPHAKTLLLSPDHNTPLYQSPNFPNNLPQPKPKRSLPRRPTSP